MVELPVTEFMSEHGFDLRRCALVKKGVVENDVLREVGQAVEECVSERGYGYQRVI